MECVDLHRKSSLPTPHHYEEGGQFPKKNILLGIELNVQVIIEELSFQLPSLWELGFKINKKEFFARNCMKCPGLHRHIMFDNFHPMRGRVQNMLQKCFARN